MRVFIWTLVFALWAMPGSANFDVKPEAVQQWADEFFAKALDERRLSGAVMTVVRDGEIIFNSGYGYEDYLKKTQIDPERTQFRIGSNTKTYTATAIAQLMEQGLIESLDDPANKYLKRDQLAKYEGKDITLRQLCTHSAGFAHRLYGLGTVDDYELPLSAAQVQARQMTIVRAPGGRTVYSNYGTALLAIIVEDITGLKIADYFEKNIFSPLGMSHSVLNMTPRATAGLAQPYAFFPNGDPQAVEHVGIHPFFAPIGSINASGADMGRYMIAQLDAGKDEVSPLGISAQGFSRMHTRIHGNHPDTASFGMIFVTDEWADEKGFGHGGDWDGFHSWMWMWPESNTGVFFAILSEDPVIGTFEGILGSERLTANAATPVLPRLTNIGTMLAFNEALIGPDTPPEGEGRWDVDNLVGSYRMELRPYGSMITFITEVVLGEGMIDVEKSGTDKLMIGGQGPYRQTDEGVFWSDQVKTGIDQEYGSSSLWTFSWDKDEERYALSPRVGGVISAVKVGTIHNPSFYSALFGLGFLVLLTGLVAIFWRAQSSVEKYSKYAATLTPVFVILSLVVLMFGYTEGDSPAAYLTRGGEGRFILSMLFANLSVVGLVTLLVTSVCVWILQNGVGLLRRIHLGLIGVAALAMLTVFIFSNFIGFNFP